MTLLSEEKEVFFENLKEMYQNFPPEGSLKAVRVKAWNHLTELGLPSKQTEVYRYIKLRKLFLKEFILPNRTNLSSTEIEKYVLQECLGSFLVFVNGFFCPELSNTDSLPDSVKISTLTDAAHSFGTFLNHQWMKGIKEEADPFVILNTSLQPNGAFVYLPPNCVLEKPLQVLNLTATNKDPFLTSPKLQFFVGANAELNLIMTHNTLSGQEYFCNQATNLHLEKGAHVKMTQCSKNHSSDAWHFDAVRVAQKKDSSFKCISVSNGAATVRQDYKVSLLEENAEVSLNGLWMLNEKREYHINILIDHHAPHCRSMQLFKGVLDGMSHSSFEGKIYVRQAAQQTDAFQLNNNLLLSDRANAESKPNLEIFADDVKASHGATVGQLDEEHLFYLRSRGYEQTTAQTLLVHSFAQEIIEMIPSSELKKNM